MRRQRLVRADDRAAAEVDAHGRARARPGRHRSADRACGGRISGRRLGRGGGSGHGGWGGSGAARRPGIFGASHRHAADFRHRRSGTACRAVPKLEARDRPCVGSIGGTGHRIDSTVRRTYRSRRAPGHGATVAQAWLGALAARPCDHRFGRRRGPLRGGRRALGPDRYSRAGDRGGGAGRAVAARSGRQARAPHRHAVDAVRRPARGRGSARAARVGDRSAGGRAPWCRARARGAGAPCGAGAAAGARAAARRTAAGGALLRRASRSRQGEPVGVAVGRRGLRWGDPRCHGLWGARRRSGERCGATTDRRRRDGPHRAC